MDDKKIIELFFERSEPLLSYIARIVRNLSLKIYRKKEAARRNSRYTTALEEIEACTADPQTVESEMEREVFV